MRDEERETCMCVRERERVGEENCVSVGTFSY